MVRVNISVSGRELPFDVPEVPTVGSTVSIQAPDNANLNEMIVTKVRWQLVHPGAADAKNVGSLREIVVECVHYKKMSDEATRNLR
jgi:hypothetical protein